MHPVNAPLLPTPSRHALRLAIITAAAATLAGCSTLDGLFSGDRIDYKSQAAKTAPLEVPPDLTQLQRDSRYQPQGDIYLYRPRGSELAPTGYLGRTTIMEFLVMDDELRRAVMRHAGMGELEQLARQAGMRTMYEDGIGKAMAGLTTIEEVLRVTEDA